MREQGDPQLCVALPALGLRRNHRADRVDEADADFLRFGAELNAGLGE